MHFREIGLNIARGIISNGICNKLITGSISFIIKSKIPEYLNALIATNKPTNVGKIFITISNPSLAPFKKISNTLFLSINPTLTINNIVNGIAKLEI